MGGFENADWAGSEEWRMEMKVGGAFDGAWKFDFEAFGLDFAEMGEL